MPKSALVINCSGNGSLCASLFSILKHHMVTRTGYLQVENTAKSPVQHAGRADVARMHNTPHRRALKALLDKKARSFLEDALVELGGH